MIWWFQLTLKRSRDDREPNPQHRTNGHNHQQQLQHRPPPNKHHQRIVVDAIGGLIGTKPSQAALSNRPDVQPELTTSNSTTTSPKLASRPLVNPKYTKIVANHLVRQAAPRHPNKSIAALRKIRSRQSLEKRKSTPAANGTTENGSPMVVTTKRCPTPELVAGSAGTSATPASVAKVATSGGDAAGDDSDTGCSSLDDDDSFDGAYISVLTIKLCN